MCCVLMLELGVVCREWTEETIFQNPNNGSYRERLKCHDLAEEKDVKVQIKRVYASLLSLMQNSGCRNNKLILSQRVGFILEIMKDMAGLAGELKRLKALLQSIMLQERLV